MAVWSGSPKSELTRHLKEMNFLSAYRSSSPICPAMQSVSADAREPLTRSGSGRQQTRRRGRCVTQTDGGNGAIDGAASALFTAGIAARTRGQVLWCVTRQDLFAPAIAQAGLAPDRVIYMEAGDQAALLACFEEGLRHMGLGVVVAEVARLSMTASRRLQLAA